MADWLLIPMCPTPNGRLHIGHGAGPYLRADAIARALRRNGDTATVITGSDAYENWVLAAVGPEQTPEQTCQHFHAGIKHDLDSLGVELDHWIDPLSDDHRDHYQHLHEHMLATLRDNGAARLEAELIPVGAETGRPLLGVWIAGRCPTCDAPAGGNTCTACGDHFHPADLRNPHSRLTDEPIRWQQQPSWFSHPHDPDTILHRLRATGLPEQFLNAPRNYLCRPGARIRLTQPGDWGITSPTIADGTVLANTYYGYSLYCGHLYTRRRANAFDPDSSVTVVGLFGSDNSIAGLVAPQILAGPAGFKPFDHTVINHMLHFAGRKCSTSKQHGIWISDLIDNTSVTSDELRYCLAQLPLDQHISDIDTATILTRINELRTWRTQQLATALHTFRTNPTPTTDLSIVGPILDQQQADLTPPHVDLAAATTAVRSWMFNNTLDLHNPQQAAQWLAGTALLTSPILPDMANELWATIGLGNRPLQMGAVQNIPTTIDRRTWAHSDDIIEELTYTELASHIRIQADS